MIIIQLIISEQEINFYNDWWLLYDYLSFYIPNVNNEEYENQ